MEYKHHGIDAIAIAYSYFFNNHIRSNIAKNQIDDNEISLFSEIKKKSTINEVKKYINEIQNFSFWTPVFHKIKKHFFDRTLYSYKKVNDNFYQIKKIKILEESNQNIQKTMSNRELFFMYHSSQKDLFDEIFNIFSKYKDI